MEILAPQGDFVERLNPVMEQGGRFRFADVSREQLVTIKGRQEEKKQIRSISSKDKHILPMTSFVPRVSRGKRREKKSVSLLCSQDQADRPDFFFFYDELIKRTNSRHRSAKTTAFPCASAQNPSLKTLLRFDLIALCGALACEPWLRGSATTAKFPQSPPG